MARITHAAQIDLRFSDSACEYFDVSAGVPPRDLTRESLHFFTKRWVRLDGKAQAVAERIFCRAGTTVIGFRPGANLSIHAVGLDLVVARQAASLLWLASSRSLFRGPLPLARSGAVFH